MRALLLDPAFWNAIAGFAWPIALLVIVFAFKPIIEGLFRRENLTMEIAGMKISVVQAAEQAGKGLADLQERLAALESSSLNSNVPDASENTKSAHKAISVLWVDDFPVNNAFIIEKLENDNVRVQKEISTAAGLNALTDRKFDVVITDLGRKEAGGEQPFAGLELIESIRSKGDMVPILVFAGRRGIENREKLLAAGATEVTASAIDVFGFVNRHRSGVDD